MPGNYLIIHKSILPEYYENPDKMEKLMNKMDNMELDKVAGGKRYVYPDDRRPNRPIKKWHVERKQVIRYR